jgi:hypothetical protein
MLLCLYLFKKLFTGESSLRIAWHKSKLQFALYPTCEGKESLLYCVLSSIIHDTIQYVF